MSPLGVRSDALDSQWSGRGLIAAAAKNTATGVSEIHSGAETGNSEWQTKTRLNQKKKQSPEVVTSVQCAPASTSSAPQGGHLAEKQLRFLHSMSTHPKGPFSLVPLHRFTTVDTAEAGDTFVLEKIHLHCSPKLAPDPPTRGEHPAVCCPLQVLA